MYIAESLHAILGERDRLADLFYQHFLERYPEVSTHFEGVNLRRQTMLLTMALMVMERPYSGNYAATAMYLSYLGSKHHDRGILQHQFPQFREALLAVLEQFHGENWGPELATQWAGAIDHTIATMLKGYK